MAETLSAVTGSQTPQTDLPPIIQSLIQRLDQEDAASPMRSKRRHPRLVFRRRDILLRVTHPGGGTIERTVWTRDLSIGGIGFIYNGFLHRSTTCQLTLPKRLGGVETLKSTVIHCTLVQGSYHLVGVKLTEPAFPKAFLLPHEMAMSKSSATVVSGTHYVNPAALSGAILVVDSGEIDRALLTHCLQACSVHLDVASTFSQAMAKLARSDQAPPDLILCDISIPDCSGTQAIVKLRESGFAGRIIAMSVEFSEQQIKGCWAAGVDGILNKPYTAAELYALLSSTMEQAEGGARDGDGIVSELVSAGNATEDVIRLVSNYIARVYETVQRMKIAINKQELTEVRDLCQTLHGTGSGFGFPQLSKAAKEAVRSLDSSCSLAESITELRALQLIATKLSADPDAAASPAG
jgi:CheY-like chemotaxis protein